MSRVFIFLKAHFLEIGLSQRLVEKSYYMVTEGKHGILDTDSLGVMILLVNTKNLLVFLIFSGDYFEL